MLKFYFTLFVSALCFYSGAQSIILADINFENTDHLDTSIIQIDSNSCWVIGEPDKLILDSAFSYPNAVMTDTLNAYPINCNSSILLKVDIWYCYYLNFRLAYDSETCKDGLVIEMSDDGAVTWVNVCDNQNYIYPGFDFYHNVSSVIQDTCSLYNGENGITGSGIQNIEINFGYISVSPTEGGWPANWHIRFRFISDSVETNQEGFLVDDIIITQYACPGGINENDNNKIGVFPNPANDFITVKNNNSKNKIGIRNLMGELVMYVDDNTNTIDISALPDGIYTIESFGFKAEKFVICNQ